MVKEKLGVGESGALENGGENLPAKISIEKVKNSTKAKVVVASAENVDVENGCRFEVLDFSELTEERITDIAEFFRYTFNNAFPEYAGCTDCETSVSAPEVFGTGRQYVPLEKLDDECNLPDCEDCGEEMKLFHDKEMTREKLAEKFQQEGKIVLVTEEGDEEIKGMTFGYYDSLAGVIDKEWGHPYNYMKKEHQDEHLNFDVDGAIEKIVESGEEVDGESEVFTWNCIMLDRTVRKNFTKLTETFLLAVADKMHEEENPLIAQTLKNSPISAWIKRLGAKEIDEIFSNEYAFIFGGLREVCYKYLTKG